MTTLSDDVKNHVELLGVPAKCSIPHIMGMGDQSLEVVGEINLSLRLGNMISEHHRLVITEGEGGTFLCIFGLDFLDAYHLCVDSVHRRLEYNSNKGLCNNCHTGAYRSIDRCTSDG